MTVLRQQRAKLRKVTLIIVGFAIFCLPLGAQDWTSRRFFSSADDVYRSAVKAIALRHDIKSNDRVGRVIEFHVGTTAWSWGYNMRLSVESESDKTSIVRLEIKKSGGRVLSWGSGRKEAFKIYRWMEADLMRPGETKK
jgi:hypothetical protein